MSDTYYAILSVYQNACRKGGQQSACMQAGTCSQNHSSGKAVLSFGIISVPAGEPPKLTEPFITAAAAEAQPFIHYKSGSSGTDQSACICENAQYTYRIFVLRKSEFVLRHS